MKVNCLEKNPAVERHYSSMSKEQRLAEIDDCIESTCNILYNLWQEKRAIEKDRIQLDIDPVQIAIDVYCNTPRWPYPKMNGNL